MRKPLGCKDISVRVHEGQIQYRYIIFILLLFIQYTSCIMWKEHFLICETKCSLSGKNDNAETEPVLKKIYSMNIDQIMCQMSCH